MIITVKDSDKPEAVDIARRFAAVGYEIYATRSTAKYLNEHGVEAIKVNKLEQPSPNLLDLILDHQNQIDLVIDTPSQGAVRSHDGFLIRRHAIETGVNVLTAIDTAEALVTSLENREEKLSLVDIATIGSR
jgi:carbamoyl-phosphate synthase large subunit